MNEFLNNEVFLFALLLISEILALLPITKNKGIVLLIISGIKEFILRQKPASEIPKLCAECQKAAVCANCAKPL